MCPPWPSARSSPFAAIFLGSALTMKVQYHRMVYEDEATLGKARCSPAWSICACCRSACAGWRQSEKRP